MRRLSEAEVLLQSLGVEAAEDIDLPTIACHLGVIAIRERRLDGCEARVIGRERHAIISVNASSIKQRRRFSVCHELGHWHLHRGETLYCKSADIGDRDVAHAKEKQANRFAADLLLPPYIVGRMASAYRELTVRAVDEIRAPFTASRSATAIQLVRLHSKPAMVAFSTSARRPWQVPGLVSRDPSLSGRISARIPGCSTCSTLARRISCTPVRSGPRHSSTAGAPSGFG